jgi:hypothetical protein
VVVLKFARMENKSNFANCVVVLKCAAMGSKNAGAFCAEVDQCALMASASNSVLNVEVATFVAIRFVQIKCPEQEPCAEPVIPIPALHTPARRYALCMLFKSSG